MQNILIGVQVFCWQKFINPLGHKTILRPSAEGWFCVLRWNEIFAPSCSLITSCSLNRYYRVVLLEKQGKAYDLYKSECSCFYVVINNHLQLFIKKKNGISFTICQLFKLPGYCRSSYKKHNCCHFKARSVGLHF